MSLGLRPPNFTLALGAAGAWPKADGAAVCGLENGVAEAGVWPKGDGADALLANAEPLVELPKGLVPVAVLDPNALLDVELNGDLD